MANYLVHMIGEDSNYLVHHGIKGQKWGVRRFQNEDGSLTPEGRERLLKRWEHNDKIRNDKIDNLTSKINKNVKKSQQFLKNYGAFIRREDISKVDYSSLNKYEKKFLEYYNEYESLRRERDRIIWEE